MDSIDVDRSDDGHCDWMVSSFFGRTELSVTRRSDQVVVGACRFLSRSGLFRWIPRKLRMAGVRNVVAPHIEIDWGAALNFLRTDRRERVRVVIMRQRS